MRFIDTSAVSADLKFQICDREKLTFTTIMGWFHSKAFKGERVYMSNQSLDHMNLEPNTVLDFSLFQLVSRILSKQKFLLNVHRA